MDKRALEGELFLLVSRLHPCFAQSAPCRNAQHYLKGLLKPLACKTGWQLAEACGDATPDKIQFLLDRAVWDVDAVRDELIGYVQERLGNHPVFGSSMKRVL
jgi:SRSO17 transposase